MAVCRLKPQYLSGRNDRRHRSWLAIEGCAASSRRSSPSTGQPEQIAGWRTVHRRSVADGSWGRRQPRTQPRDRTRPGIVTGALPAVTRQHRDHGRRYEIDATAEPPPTDPSRERGQRRRDHRGVHPQLHARARSRPVRALVRGQRMKGGCSHLDQVGNVSPTSEGCEDCLRIGGWWVHLRMCMSCGHVGCCDDSPNRHATGHFGQTGHPLVQSYEPGEDWWFCYADDVAFVPQGMPTFAHP